MYPRSISLMTAAHGLNRGLPIVHQRRKPEWSVGTKVQSELQKAGDKIYSLFNQGVHGFNDGPMVEYDPETTAHGLNRGLPAFFI